MGNAVYTPVTTSQRVEELLAQMNLGEKIGQMTQVERMSIDKDDLATYSIGSLLSGGGSVPTPNTPQGWLDMINEFQRYALKSRLGIPLIYGVDAVHGHNNLYGATIFPHNIGLGATRNPDLIERIGRATAVEVAACGIHWDFAPAVSVPRDIRWGRTYEGYSENTQLVSELGAAYVRGLQKDLASPSGILASVKHFVGDGGTKWGSTGRFSWIDTGSTWHDPAGVNWQIDQGVTDIDETQLRTIHLPPYKAAIEAGALNIMVSYSSWGGLKMHQHHYLLTEVLKGELGFKGFLISDYRAIDQIDPDYYVCVVKSINAGLDMIMVPFDYKLFISSLTKAVEAGDVSMARIDDAVRRILFAKEALGLLDRPLADESFVPFVGSPAHRAIALEAVHQSQVLLKNEGNLLPLSPEVDTILVAGTAADNIGLQCGGWTIEWMGNPGRITEGSTILEGIKAIAKGDVLYSPNAEVSGRADVGIVVLAEQPYAEGKGDMDNLTLPADDVLLLQKVRQLCNKLVVVLLSGRPLVITDQLPEIDAFVAAWLPGSEGHGVADNLFGKVPYTGKLSQTWPRHLSDLPLGHNGRPVNPLWDYGFGLTS